MKHQTRVADYLDWRQPHTDHTIVGLELAGHGLIAVGSHEAEFVRESRELVTSTYLECAAVSINLQGAVLPEVEPCRHETGALAYGERKRGRADRDGAATSVGLVASTRLT